MSAPKVERFSGILSLTDLTSRMGEYVPAHQHDAAVASLSARVEVLEERLRALVEHEGVQHYRYLDKGIGTATLSGERWILARAALTPPAKEPS